MLERRREREAEGSRGAVGPRRAPRATQLPDSLQPGNRLVHGIAHPQAEIGRHLVVPAAPGVHLAARRADKEDVACRESDV